MVHRNPEKKTSWNNSQLDRIIVLTIDGTLGNNNVYDMMSHRLPFRIHELKKL